MQQYNLFDNLFNRSLTFQISFGGATRLDNGAWRLQLIYISTANGMMQTLHFTVREGDTWRLGADLKVGCAKGGEEINGWRKADEVRFVTIAPDSMTLDIL